MYLVCGRHTARREGLMQSRNRSGPETGLWVGRTQAMTRGLGENMLREKTCSLTSVGSVLGRDAAAASRRERRNGRHDAAVAGQVVV